ncbi:MAG: hypothetical protein OEN20_11390, partial [Gammaproteobacteria bacterium]|nr:hypothetical protein [Gammaproteobacteria bacterium]
MTTYVIIFRAGSDKSDPVDFGETPNAGFFPGGCPYIQQHGWLSRSASVCPKSAKLDHAKTSHLEDA